jgi:hypothetical protein
LNFLALTRALLALALLEPATVRAQDAVPPVVDTHVHYNRETWNVYGPQEAIALMQEAGITWALVSSTPDDGTLQLYELAPDVVVPFLRPYRAAADFATWTRDPGVLDYVEERLTWGIPYQGIGEFELAPAEAEHMVVRRLSDIAADRGLWLHVHAGVVALRELASVRPDGRVLWAHAGVDASPADVGQVLVDYPNVWVEVSLRSAEIAPEGVLGAGWRQLFVDHVDRIMVGSDTWLPRDWTALPRTHAVMQSWLQQLPPDVAAKLGYANAERLFVRPAGR